MRPFRVQAQLKPALGQCVRALTWDLSFGQLYRTDRFDGYLARGQVELKALSNR
jgi:hypothetical protein